MQKIKKTQETGNARKRGNKKQKWKYFFAGIAIHSILSLTALGAVRVYQNGYNLMHHEPVCMAVVSIQEDNTEIQILHRTFHFEKVPENHVLYYLGYMLTDTPMHIWTAIFHTFFDKC